MANKCHKVNLLAGLVLSYLYYHFFLVFLDYPYLLRPIPYVPSGDSEGTKFRAIFLIDYWPQ